jgi:hypothetical protein
VRIALSIMNIPQRHGKSSQTLEALGKIARKQAVRSRSSTVICIRDNRNFDQLPENMTDDLRVQLKKVAALRVPAKLSLHSTGPDNDPGP